MKTMKKVTRAMVAMATLASGTGLLGMSACTLKQDDAARFGQAIPKGQEVALSVPGSQAAGTTTHASARRGGGITIAGNPPGAGSFAEWYVFTRDVSDGVDVGTLLILGVVDIIAHTTPTSVSAHQAVWGPGNGNALDPVVWRMTVTESGSEEYDYKLEGRPKASTSESDFKAVLTGHGFGEARPEHKSGWFSIDQDASNALDPLRAHDSGTIKVTFDGRAYPIAIRAVVTHTADAQSFDVSVTHNQDTSGAVDIHAHGDVEIAKDGRLENVVLHSRWTTTGAGRADVKIIGGDAPSVGILASECWSTSFARSYYADDAGYRPSEGSASSCVLPVATF
jgi:hypothetical protein